MYFSQKLSLCSPGKERRRDDLKYLHSNVIKICFSLQTVALSVTKIQCHVWVSFSPFGTGSCFGSSKLAEIALFEKVKMKTPKGNFRKMMGNFGFLKS